MNLKAYYDAAVTAETEVQSVLNQMDELLTAGNKDEALALRPALDEAKNKAKEANEIYLMMREGAESTGKARNFVPVSGNAPKSENKAQKTRAEFEALAPAERLSFIRDGGKIEE